MYILYTMEFIFLTYYTWINYGLATWEGKSQRISSVIFRWKSSVVQKHANNGRLSHEKEDHGGFHRGQRIFLWEWICSFLRDFSVITEEIRHDMLTCKLYVSATRERKSRRISSVIFFTNHRHWNIICLARDIPCDVPCDAMIMQKSVVPKDFLGRDWKSRRKSAVIFSLVWRATFSSVIFWRKITEESLRDFSSRVERPLYTPRRNKFLECSTMLEFEDQVY